MRDLLKKIGRLCENHVEKIVLVLIGLVCFWLFFTRVIFSPNVVAVGDKTFSPGQVDEYIKEKADELQQRLNPGDSSEVAAESYTPKITGTIGPNEPINPLNRPLPQGFAGLFERPLGYLDMDMALPQPSRGTQRYVARYTLPRVGTVTDVAANHIRAAAWVPVQDVTPETTYDRAQVEPNDIDLVTVEAKFDVAALYRQFEAHFAGEEVEKKEWRDPSLADPTFAAVQLQRQEMQDDGTWSAWQEVPRSRVEPYQDLFQVVERIEDLPPGGLDVRLMQFERKDITMDLLQPEAYQIASAEEDWFPPTYYTKFKELQRKMELEERRKEWEERLEEREQESGRRRDTTMGQGGRAAGGRYRTNRATGGAGNTMYGRDRGRTRGQTDRTGMRGGRGAPGDDAMYGDMYANPDMMRDGRREPTTDEVYIEFRDALLNYQTDLSKLDEPLLFWAFDDTTEPGTTYRYRIRVGVFNPVAGTERLVEEDADRINQVVLWSDFSDVTKPVAIPKMLYLFATNVQEQTKTATVEVARYRLGYWRTEDFRVRPGEVIGKEVEPKIEEEEDPLRTMPGRITDPMYMDRMMGTPMTRENPNDPTKPKVIDYRTGKVLVDLVPTNDWGTPPNLQPRAYHEMLYTGDGDNIEHMPVRSTYWPKDILASYQYVASQKRIEPQEFRDFKKGGSRGRGPRGRRGMEGMYDPMMEMGPGGPY